MRKKFWALLMVSSLATAMLFGVASAQAYPGYTTCYHSNGTYTSQLTLRVTWETRSSDSKVRARNVYLDIQSGVDNYRHTYAWLYTQPFGSFPGGQWPDGNTYLGYGAGPLYSGSFFYGDAYYLGVDGTEPWMDKDKVAILWSGEVYAGSNNQNVQASIRNTPNDPHC